MSGICQFYKSTIGKKVIMALTGLLMVAFVIGHMAGNLKIFATCDAGGTNCKIDHYAEFLHMIGADMLGRGGFLWITRIVLLASAVLHVDSAIRLSLLNKAARETSYRSQAYSSSTLASRSMAIGGVILALFIIFHILHFTTGTLHFSGFVEHNVYDNITRSFQNPLPVLVYVVAMGALGLHLYHGAWSAFQTLGLDSPSTNKFIRIGAKAVAFSVAIGFVLVPLSVFFGFVPLFNPVK